MVVYFGEEVEKALRNYLETYRKAVTPIAGYENALFLSTKDAGSVCRRLKIWLKSMPVRLQIKESRHISSEVPMVLPFIKETGDIYLVADVLGHKDVNTTKKHYAAIDEDRRRSAANVVKLREP